MNHKRHVSLNMDVRGLGQSATIAINDRSKLLQSEGREIYRLGLGQSPFPVPTAVVEALRHHAAAKDYLPAQGHPILREAVAGFHRRRHGIEANADNVLIGPGSKELMFLMQLCFYGELILPTPCWVSYGPQAKILGRKLSFIHTDPMNQYRITAEQLEAHITSEDDDYRPRLLILNYPSNPTGCTFSADDLKVLADVVRKYEVIVLSDEIYGELHFKGEHVSISRFYPEGTIISSGLSKWCGAGGWRLGTFTFPPNLDWLLETMTSVASETYTSVSAPIQAAAITAFRGDVSIERYLSHSRRILSTLGRMCCDILAEGGINVYIPAGGFYLYPDFSPLAELLAVRGIANSIALCNRLLEETGVAILPAVNFERPVEELSARIAFVDFDGSQTLIDSERIPLDQPLTKDFIETHCFKTLRAMHLICDWLGAA